MFPSAKLTVETRKSKFEIRHPREDEFRHSSFDFLSGVWRWTIRIAAAVPLIASPAIALAQGCAMCYNTAAAAKAAGIQALRSGILILLIPPMLITFGIFVLAMKRADRFNDEGPEAEGDLVKPLPQRTPVPSAEMLAGRPPVLPGMDAVRKANL